MELDSKVPIYIQIVSMVKKRIIYGHLKGGDRMPSVRDFATELKVNPNTIQRVYTELENDNYIYTKRGIGKFVTEDASVISKAREEIVSEAVVNFVRECKNLGLSLEEIIKIISDNYKED